VTATVGSTEKELLV